MQTGWFARRFAGRGTWRLEAAMPNGGEAGGSLGAGAIPSDSGFVAWVGLQRGRRGCRWGRGCWQNSIGGGVPSLRGCSGA